MYYIIYTSLSKCCMQVILKVLFVYDVYVQLIVDIDVSNNI